MHPSERDQTPYDPELDAALNQWRYISVDSPDLRMDSPELEDIGNRLLALLKETGDLAPQVVNQLSMSEARFDRIASLLGLTVIVDQDPWVAEMVWKRLCRDEDRQVRETTRSMDIGFGTMPRHDAKRVRTVWSRDCQGHR